MKKKGLRYWLSVVSAAVCIVYLLLRIFGIIDNRMHLNSYHAYASSWDTRVLEPQEAIGLYGTRLNVTYTGIDQIDRYFTCELMNTWDMPAWPTTSADSRLFASGHWGENFNALWFYPQLTQQYIDSWTSTLNRGTFLIYGCPFPAGIFQTTSSLAHPNLIIDGTFQIPIDIINIEQMVLFERNTSSMDPGWSVIRHTTSGATFSSTQMVFASNGTGYGQSVVTPFPEYVDNETGVNMGMFNIQMGSLLSENLWTYSGQQFRLNGCNVTRIHGRDWFLLYIQCPEITTNYNPPLPQTTEPPPETTRADFTTYNFTYDLSPLETNQQNQIRLQNQQVEIELAQLNGINYICRRLDDIYNQMVRNGEIPVNLINADTLPRDSDIEAFIQGQTTYTLAQLPPDDYFEKADTLTDLIREFTDRYSWFYIIGMFSLALGVACWIIFKGRG